MKKILVSILFFCLLACGNKPGEKKINETLKPKETIRYGKYIKLPENLFGINFCSLKLKDIKKQLENSRKLYEIYDCDGNLFSSLEYKGEFQYICSYVSDVFIGSGLDKNQIIKISYGYLPHLDNFSFTIVMKVEYYDEALKILNDKLGYKYAFYNMDDYEELSWRADPNVAIPTCISKIVLSKRLRYAEPEKGVFYLEIYTRGRTSHVH